MLPRIDRAAALRKDTDGLMRALDAKDTLLVPVWRDKTVITHAGDPHAVIPTVATASALIDTATELAWLGLVGKSACFALDISDLADPLAHSALTGTGQLADLRMVGGILPPEEAEIVGYARGLMYWHGRHRFCGACGQTTKPREGGHV
jgi:NAD+ diphosphatase